MLVLLGILLIVAPTVAMLGSLGDSVSALIDKVNNNTLVIPAPSADIASIPLIGAKLHALWTKASVDLPSLLISYKPQLGDTAKQTVTMLASMGAACWASSPLSSWLASSWPGVHRVPSAPIASPYASPMSARASP